MDKLNFYTVDPQYVQFLRNTENEAQGFSHIPNMDYGNKHKPKFLCGIVLQINDMDYYVPVTSYKQQKPDNFLIKTSKGQVVSSSLQLYVSGSSRTYFCTDHIFRA